MADNNTRIGNDYTLNSTHFHNVNSRYSNYSLDTAKALEESLYWVIHVLDLTWNEDNDDLWLHSGWEINQEWYLLNWEIFEWIEHILKTQKWALAIVYKSKEKTFGIHATKIANDLQDFLYQNELADAKEEDKEELENNPPHKVDKTFKKTVQVRAAIDLNSWKKITRINDIINSLKDLSKDEEEFQLLFWKFKHILNKR